MVLEWTTQYQVALREREMMTSADVEGNNTFQNVSTVVDAMFLYLNAKDLIGSAIERPIIRAILENILKAIQNSPPMRRAIQAFLIVWKGAGGSMMRRADALICLLWQFSEHGILWAAIKSQHEGMSTADLGKLCLSCVPLFLTPGSLAVGLKTLSFLIDFHDFF